MSARLYGTMYGAQHGLFNSKGHDEIDKDWSTYITVGNIANVEKHGRIWVQFIPV